MILIFLGYQDRFQEVTLECLIINSTVEYTKPQLCRLVNFWEDHGPWYQEQESLSYLACTPIFIMRVWLCSPRDDLHIDLANSGHRENPRSQMYQLNSELHYQRTKYDSILRSFFAIRAGSGYIFWRQDIRSSIFTEDAIMVETSSRNPCSSLHQHRTAGWVWFTPQRPRLNSKLTCGRYMSIAWSSEPIFAVQWCVQSLLLLMCLN